jgi:hypothetical protein
VNDDKPTEVYYRLARSVVEISGEVTSGFDPKTSQKRTSATSDIELTVAADPRLDWRCPLPMGRSFMKDKEFDLKFASDGRLTSSSATVTGAGGAIVEAGVRVAAFVGSAVVAAVAKGLEEARPEPEPRTFDQVLSDENEDLYKRRESYRASIVALQDKLAQHGAQVAANPGAPGLLLQGTVIRGTLERIRMEAAEVEAEVDAWRRKRFPSELTAREFAIGTDELPNIDAAGQTATFNLNELTSPVREAAEQLGVLVARVAEVDEDDLNWTSEDLTDESGIWFRTARPVDLALYERELGSTGEFRLRSVTRTWVVDSESRLGFVRFDSGLFEKQVGALEFGDTGALSGLTSAGESAARQVSAALSAAPGQVKESVEQASAVVEGLTKLRATGAERRLADLKRRKETIDAEIAEKGALATRAQREELDRLDAQIDVVDAQKKLAPEPVAPPSPNKELEDRLARATLGLQLKQAEFEMEWLARLRPPSD